MTLKANQAKRTKQKSQEEKKETAFGRVLTLAMAQAYRKIEAEKQTYKVLKGSATAIKKSNTVTHKLITQVVKYQRMFKEVVGQLRQRFGESKLKRKAPPTLIGSQTIYLHNQVKIYPVPLISAPLKKKDPMVKLEEAVYPQNGIDIIDLESNNNNNNENIDPRLLNQETYDEGFGASEDIDME